MLGLRFNLRLFIFGLLYLAGVLGLAKLWAASALEGMSFPEALFHILSLSTQSLWWVMVLALMALFPGLLMLVLAVFPRIKILPWL